MNCTPNPRQGRGVFFMKFTFEFKLDCVTKYKKGEYINYQGTPNQRCHFMTYVREWVVRYDKYGVDGLKHSSTNKVNKTFSNSFLVLSGFRIFMDYVYFYFLYINNFTLNI